MCTICTDQSQDCVTQKILHFIWSSTSVAWLRIWKTAMLVWTYLGENDQNTIITTKKYIIKTLNFYQNKVCLLNRYRICLCAYTDHYLHLSVLFNVCKLIPLTLIIRLIILSWHFLTSKMFQLFGQLIWGFSLPEILLWEKYPNVYLTKISRD